MSTLQHEQAPRSQFDIMMLALRGTENALALAIKMQEAAQLDPLTGLQNRRALMGSYEGLHASANNQRRNRKSNQPVALLLADVDKFKSINDEYGHGVGDDVLKGVAGIMRQSVRQRDVVARWGGEEFAMLLPRANRKTALRIAEGIRENVAASDLMSDVKDGRPVTLSLGVAMINNLDDPLELSMTKADLALYAAKDQGRNQVVFASELQHMPQFQGVTLEYKDPGKAA